jgi:hypothetical protein
MKPFPYTGSFSPREYEILRRGLIPAEMEDKWFVFWEADSLFFHRSWTGHGIYQVTFRPSSRGFDVSHAAVATEVDYYRRGSDHDEARLLDFLIRGLLLRQPVQFPVPAGFQGPAGLYQHHVAGTGWPERVAEGGASAALWSAVRRWFGM